MVSRSQQLRENHSDAFDGIRVEPRDVSPHSLWFALPWAQLQQWSRIVTERRRS